MQNTLNELRAMHAANAKARKAKACAHASERALGRRAERVVLVTAAVALAGAIVVVLDLLVWRPY